MKKILIVGCGFSGSVIARELAENGYLVEIIDKRNHIGGNAYDYMNDIGIMIHKYGPHLFHTNNKSVFDYMSKFTEWVPYKHKVKAQLSNGEYVTLPINKETTEIVGKENLIDLFIRPYSEKMWGMKLEEISQDIINRVPIREDENDLYFPDDVYQFIPKNGYTKLFENLLNHESIKLNLGVKFTKSMEQNYDFVFNSMPIDEYYEYKFGELNYRSLKFHSVDLPMSKVLPVVQVNFTNLAKYTRIVEYKNLPYYDKPIDFTTVVYEEPCDYKQNNYERYYPVKDKDGENRELYLKYSEIENPKVKFIGRLGLYVYMDMHQCINSSLKIVKDYINSNI